MVVLDSSSTSLDQDLALAGAVRAATSARSGCSGARSRSPPTRSSRAGGSTSWCAASPSSRSAISPGASPLASRSRARPGSPGSPQAARSCTSPSARRSRTSTSCRFPRATCSTTRPTASPASTARSPRSSRPRMSAQLHLLWLHPGPGTALPLPLARARPGRAQRPLLRARPPPRGLPDPIFHAQGPHRGDLRRNPGARHDRARVAVRDGCEDARRGAPGQDVGGGLQARLLGVESGNDEIQRKHCENKLSDLDKAEEVFRAARTRASRPARSA